MVYIDPPEVIMVSNQDFGVFSNNNYLEDMNQMAGAQQPVTEAFPPFQYYNQQTRLPSPTPTPGLQVPVESGVSPYFSNQSLSNPQDTHSQNHCLGTPSFNSGSNSNILSGHSTPEMSYAQIPPQPQGPAVWAMPYPQTITTQTLPVGVGVNPYPGGFTFNVPTQASPITGIPTQSYHSRGVTHCHAPGLGAAWQHAVPPQMPWGDGMRMSYGITIFTGDQLSRPGIVSLTQSMAPSRQSVDNRTRTTRDIGNSLMSVREASPRPIIHSEPLMTSRKLKRHAPKEKELDSSLLGIDKKVFISEKKMMQSMKELSLYSSNHQPPSLQIPMTCTTSVTPMTSDRAERLQHFKDIEERLVLDDSDVEDSEPESSQGPKLKILDSFSQGILKPSTLLPQKLLEDITNRRSMEVVLWKPPGDFAKGLAPKSENQNQIQFCWKNQDRVGDSNLMRSCDGSNTSPSIPDNKQSDESVTMETELFDNQDDDMQL